MQERIDRIFYGESYDRGAPVSLRRTLSATTALERLLTRRVSRCAKGVLTVERVAIFVEDARSPGGYRVARSSGLSNDVIVPPDSAR